MTPQGANNIDLYIVWLACDMSPDLGFPQLFCSTANQINMFINFKGENIENI